MSTNDAGLIIALAVVVEQIVRQLKDLILKPAQQRYPTIITDTVYMWIVRVIAFALGFGGAWFGDLDLFEMFGYSFATPVGAIAIGAIVTAGEAGVHRVLDFINTLMGLTTLRYAFNAPDASAVTVNVGDTPPEHTHGVYDYSGTPVDDSGAVG